MEVYLHSTIRLHVVVLNRGKLPILSVKAKALLKERVKVVLLIGLNQGSRIWRT